MALKLTENYNGMAAEYWRINTFNYDDRTDTAVVSLWLYFNKEASDSNLGNGLKREVFNIKGIKQTAIPEELSEIANPRDLLKALLYVKIKESKMIQDEDKVDEEGNPVMIESNRFALSEDC